MDFDTVLITDSRIEQITDRCTFGVKSGASSSTYQSFEAVSKSTNTITHNINVPSESVVLDRNISILNEMVFSLSFATSANIANGASCDFDFFYKVLVANSFPFNSLVNTIQCNINNTSLSINLNDLKPFLTPLINKKQLQKYNGLCPTLDHILIPGVAGTTTERLQSVNKTFSSSYPGSLYGNEIYSVRNVTLTSPGGVLTTNNNIIRYTNNSGAAQNAGTIISLNFTIETVEPIFLSPFIFNGISEYNNAGLVGINTLNMVFNLDPSALRAFYVVQRTIGNNGFETVDNINLSLKEIKKSQIQCSFLSLQPSQLVQSKNCVPFIDFPRYITTYNSTVDANASVRITSNSLQLNQIPDYLLIGIRNRPITTNPRFLDGSVTLERQYDRFLPITSMNINFNNVSGLLSSATEYDLYKISVKNGLQCSWPEFSNIAPSGTFVSGAGGISALNSACTGSFIVLDPSMDLSLPDFYSNGSIGVFSLQVEVTVNNRTGSQISSANGGLELVIVCCNAGIFNTVQGSSNTNSGLLNKEIVMNTKSQQSQSAMSSSLYHRLVGGSLSNSIGSAMRKIAPTRSNVVASSSGGARSKPYKGGLDQFV